MSTVKEIAEKYANQIKKAIKKTKIVDGATSYHIKEAFKENDPLLETFKDIYREINDIVYEGTARAISEEEKKIILTNTAQILNYSEPNNLYRLVKEANNENAIEFINYISQFINDVEGEE